MANPQKIEQRYTWADYSSWNDENRCEIIDGIVFDMCPAPNTKHQLVATKIISKLDYLLSSKGCMVFSAPFDVRLPNKGESEKKCSNIVQPDVTVYCDKSKLTTQGGVGAPDLVVEILSPSTTKRDRLIKYNLYQQAGVPEYWIVDTDNEVIEVYLLQSNGEFSRKNIYDKNEKFFLSGHAECEIDSAKIFKNY